MPDDRIMKEANWSMAWWKRYYHILLGLHFMLGILGILVGALIAVNVTQGWSVFHPQSLGVISTVIVGIVSFVQPGRMASVFYGAYWRMRVAIIRYSNGQIGDTDLVNVLARGYTAVAEIQPDAIAGDDPGANGDLLTDLTPQERALLLERREEILKDRKPDPETPDPETPDPTKEV